MSQNLNLIDIQSIDGIGPATAEQLVIHRIFDTADLLTEDRHEMASRLADVSGVTYEQMRYNYIPQAELLRVSQITPDLAEHLVTKRIDNLTQLAWLIPETIERYAREAEQTIDNASMITSDALRHSSTCSILLSVSTIEGGNVEGGNVFLPAPEPGGHPFARQETLNQSGRVLIQNLAPGRRYLEIVSPNHARVLVTITLSEDMVGRVQKLSIGLNEGDSSVPVIDEFSNGPDMRIGNFPFVNRKMEVDEIPDQSVWSITHQHEDTTRIMCAQHRVNEGYQQTYYADIDNSNLASMSLEGAEQPLIQKSESGWTALEHTQIQDWRRSQWSEVEIEHE